MKKKYPFSNVMIVSVLVFLITFPWIGWAKEISLLDQPQEGAKMVAKIDLAQGVIPIYTPKGSGWVKIADPKNGNVGWIKSTELAGASETIFTFTQSKVNDNKSPAAFRVIQFGQPTQLTAEQTQTMMREIQAERQAIHQSMQNIMRDMDKFFYDDWHFMHEHFPAMVPMVIPVQKNVKTSQIQQKAKEPTTLKPSSTTLGAE